MSRKEVWVAGEVLIDLIPDHKDILQAVVGGGPANTCRALANLKIPTKFISGISSDKYGESIRNVLETSFVDLTLTLKSDLPTALAKVSLNESGSAHYSFELINTASFDFNEKWLPKGNPAVLHIGTLATLIEPGSSELFCWAVSLNAPIVFDPNVRPSVLGDKKKYRASVERWIEISHVVKLSEDDFEWLYPTLSSPIELLSYGPSLVVITKGSQGLEGIYRGGTIFVPSYEVDVVDTIGAGDTVGAILVEAIFRDGLDALVPNLESVLSRAAKAAAIVCSRPGAQPPSLAELDAL